MSWRQRLKRVFHIDIEHCGVCGATLRVIACIETPLKCRSRSEPLGHRENPHPSRRARDRRHQSPPRTAAACARRRTPGLPITEPTLTAPALRHGPVAPRFLRPSAHPVIATCFHDCRLQIAAFRPRTVCSRADIEPDNDHPDTPATMSIDGLFFLSVDAENLYDLSRLDDQLVLGI